MFPALAFGALSLGKTLFDALGKKKQAKEQDKAAQAGFEARKTRFGQDEGMRSARLGGMQSFLQRYQPSLGAGAPQYGLDPETLAKLQAARSYAEAAPGKTSAGMGSALLGGLMGTGAELARAAALGGEDPQAAQQGIPPMLQAPDFKVNTFYNPEDYK